MYRPAGDVVFNIAHGAAQRHFAFLDDDDDPVAVGRIGGQFQTFGDMVRHQLRAIYGRSACWGMSSAITCQGALEAQKM